MTSNIIIAVGMAIALVPGVRGETVTGDNYMLTTRAGVDSTKAEPLKAYMISSSNCTERLNLFTNYCNPDIRLGRKAKVVVGAVMRGIGPNGVLVKDYTEVFERRLRRPVADRLRLCGLKTTLSEDRNVMDREAMALKPPPEDNNEFGFEVTADFFSKYVYRGQNITDGWVFQPGISVGYSGLTLGYWGNLDLTGANDASGEFIEHDWYLDYSGQITDVIGYWVGAAHYVFPERESTFPVFRFGGPEVTTELYAGVNFDVPASPSVTVYYDIDEVDGAYVAFEVGRSFEPVDDLPLDIDLSANLGWGDSSYNDASWGVDKGQLNDLTVSAAFPFDVGPVTITPSMHCVVILGSDVRDAAGDDDSIFYTGAGLAYDF